MSVRSSYAIAFSRQIRLPSSNVAMGVRPQHFFPWCVLMVVRDDPRVKILLELLQRCVDWSVLRWPVGDTMVDDEYDDEGDATKPHSCLRDFL
jgi:hypothetical protein